MAPDSIGVDTPGTRNSLDVAPSGSTVDSLAMNPARATVDSQAVDLGTPLGPYEPTFQPEHKAVTFRGYPYPETKSFWLVQSGFLFSTPRHSREPSPRYVFDLGLMRNLGTKWALGANAHFELASHNGNGTGLVLRGRRWLSREVSVDLATGFLNPQTNAEVEDGGGNTTSWITQANMNFNNVVAISVQANRWKDNYSMQPSDPSTGSSRVETGTDWYLGGSLQYVPALIALIPLYLVAAASNME